MNKLIMCKGLPASGKDTWAAGVIKTSGGKTKRVNKDMLREMIDAGAWSKERERNILKIRNNLISSWLGSGYDVICTDTNLAPKHEETLKTIAAEFNAQFIVEDSFLKVSITECIERDLKRGKKSVGKEVITKMYYDFIFKPPLSSDKSYIGRMIGETPFIPCIVIDIDGTMAFKGKRNPYDLSKVKEDKFNYALWEVIKYFPHPIVFLSGREGTEQCKRDTMEWLTEHIGHNKFSLIMRKEGDSRADYIIKEELLRSVVIDELELNPIMIFDDRDQVVDMWRQRGIFTAQVNYGGF